MLRLLKAVLPSGRCRTCRERALITVRTAVLSAVAVDAVQKKTETQASTAAEHPVCNNILTV